MKTRNKTPELLSAGAGYGKQYWADAAAQLKNVKILVFAALFIALRVLVKNPFFNVQVLPGLKFTLDCYVNAVGAMVCGPVVSFLSGAISDTLGCMLFPMAGQAYFPPFMLVEMLSSLIFALFLWKRKITVGRVLLTKFTVNVVCNLIVNPLILKWQYYALGSEGTVAALINGVRIGKNLILFPFEAAFIVLFISALFPLLHRVGVVPKDQARPEFKVRHWLMIAIVTLASIALVLFYWLYLKDFISEHNFKLF
jgi:ECF transporter S component (folate family)